MQEGREGRVAWGTAQPLQARLHSPRLANNSHRGLPSEWWVGRGKAAAGPKRISRGGK
jgi:hypothetical protein